MQRRENLRRYVLVTGSAGGIGGAICKCLRGSGVRVLGVDRPSATTQIELDAFIGIDLARLVESDSVEQDMIRAISDIVGEAGLAAVVNNAAYQQMGGIEDIDRAGWRRSFDVNVGAPLFLTRICLPHLRRGNGCVVNISSIHARLTKPDFLAYATSKSAMSGLTRSMSLEIGADIPVFGIEPGAVDTQMLRAGFLGKTTEFDILRRFQPLGDIVSPEEIASLVEFLVVKRPRALSGSMIEAGGGIAARLHDPV